MVKLNGRWTFSRRAKQEIFVLKNKVSNSLFYGFFLSLFTHILFGLLLWRVPIQTPSSPSEENELIFVEYPAHRQIVTQKDFNKIRPKDSAYLSQADKSVEKETQAMLKGLFQQGQASPSSLFKKEKSKNFRSPSSQKRPHTPPSQAEIKELPLQMNLKEGDLKSSLSIHSQTVDFLPGVELGSHTLLNTKEFRYYSYFSRMKEQLYWRWIHLFRESAPVLSSRLAKQKAQGFFHTSLYVYLSPDGEIQDISVVKSSGVESIDSLALYAFLQSAPFPNPPTGLVEEDGLIHIRQSFNLYIQPSLLNNLAFK